MADSILQENLYEHYEISNYALRGKKAKHNSSYWAGEPYIGIGPSAHSFNLITRSWNISDIKQYIESLSINKRPFEEERLSKENRINEYLMTSLRTSDGINIEKLNELYPEKTYLKITRKQKFAKLITNAYTTKTGGIVFYDWRNITRFNNLKNKVYFCDHKNDYELLIDKDNTKKSKFNSKIGDRKVETSLKREELGYDSSFPINYYRTLIWLDEENHNVNCEPNVLLVKNGDFISKNFEITPDRFSKTSGLVVTNQKNNIIQTLTIKSGLIYEGKKISSKIKGKKLSTKLKKLFFYKLFCLTFTY